MSTVSIQPLPAEVLSATSARATRGHVIRALRDDEHRAAQALMAGAFHTTPATDEQWQQRAACYQSGRAFGAFDAELIGVARSTGTCLTVPGGGQLAAHMVMDVAVRADRTRRGVMTDLMKAQLTDMAGRGITVAVLKASEGGIYRRFGYGVSTRARTYRVDRRGLRVRDEVPRDGQSTPRSPGHGRA